MALLQKKPLFTAKVLHSQKYILILNKKSKYWQWIHLITINLVTIKMHENSSSSLWESSLWLKDAKK